MLFPIRTKCHDIEFLIPETDRVGHPRRIRAPGSILQPKQVVHDWRCGARVYFSPWGWGGDRIEDDLYRTLLMDQVLQSLFSGVFATEDVLR